MVEVVATDEFRDWYLSLDQSDRAAVYRQVTRLEQYGVTLGFPHSSDIKDSKYPFRELRIQSGGAPLRAYYIFDATREAVILCGGDKTGQKRFYDEMTARAEKIWEQYLKEQGR